MEWIIGSGAVIVIPPNVIQIRGYKPGMWKWSTNSKKEKGKKN